MIQAAYSQSTDPTLTTNVMELTQVRIEKARVEAERRRVQDQQRDLADKQRELIDAMTVKEEEEGAADVKVEPTEQSNYDAHFPPISNLDIKGIEFVKG